MLSPDHRYYLIYTNEEGHTYEANLSMQTLHKDALTDIEKFEKETLDPLKVTYEQRLKDVSTYAAELKKESTSLVRRLGGVLAVALITPVPGAFETALTVGLIYVAYKKFTEKPGAAERKKHVEFLIGECENAENSLEEFKDKYLNPFSAKWRKEFEKDSNHYVSAENETDIRILDIVVEKYVIDKAWIKRNGDWEIKSSLEHCKRETQEEKDSRNQEQEKKWRKNGPKTPNRVEPLKAGKL
ncbi:hypothetical protein EHQ53_11425 [Leptospira langatensis]|uniref:Uncharacterized protein n=1 Tax=Leptospira langatensis TaxID=2484983 RepID=A0A5F1ZUV9_9LEPT|nr:hypothetical protein [Leptospira langatensis]TGJ98841.1 hypothetical protein EHO57_15075 [Leptospira langatensis]TGL40769.1 hypothetical protein EHQ53_11425 [Leptospira langatensis]